MMDFVELLAQLDDSPELHESRILILLHAFTSDSMSGAIEGITKLAKHDFLLRYPTMLQRALEAKGFSVKDVRIEDYEYHSVESEMVRYRFGPWDHRYRYYLNLLASKGLIKIITEGRKVIVSLTESGYRLANTFIDYPEFQIYSCRAKILKRHFDMSATNLMKFIYDTFPEVISLHSGKRISI